MTSVGDVPSVLRAIRASLDLTQAELAERLGVSFATVNRWEGGRNKPQKAPMARILALASDAGVDVDDAESSGPAPARRRGRAAADYNLNPAKWVRPADDATRRSIPELLDELSVLDARTVALHESLAMLLKPVVS